MLLRGLRDDACAVALRRTLAYDCLPWEALGDAGEDAEDLKAPQFGLRYKL